MKREGGARPARRRGKAAKTPSGVASVSSPSSPAYVSAGRVEKTIDVGLSYKIVELFSEGLYTSANKAFEELVTNSFDAGARNVHILLPTDPTAPEAAIVVVDDGEAMNVLGLEELWQIGFTQKRTRADPPLGRRQIGKFGIGKLATYVLCERLTYLCRSEGAYYAITMDYTILDKAAKGVVAAAKPLKLHIRKLTAREIKESLEGWLSSRSLKKWPVKLFGRSAPKSWTFAILSSLRNKAAAIQSGKLDWILRTALPLRDDFSIFLDGKKLPPSKIAKEKIATWILGRDIRELPKPKDVVVRLDRNVPASSASYFGLYHPTLGRVTGYAEAYKDVLTTGKSIEIGRSYGSLFMFAVDL